MFNYKLSVKGISGIKKKYLFAIFYVYFISFYSMDRSDIWSLRLNQIFTIKCVVSRKPTFNWTIDNIAEYCWKLHSNWFNSGNCSDKIIFMKLNSFLMKYFAIFFCKKKMYRIFILVSSSFYLIKNSIL